MMRRWILIITAGLSCASLHAQENNTYNNEKENISKNERQEICDGFKHDANLKPIDSLHLSIINSYGQISPFNHNFHNDWEYPQWKLHEGLNLSVEASVFTQVGKHAYHGTGFSQNISMMYALPLTNKLSFAIGGFFNNVSWMHNTYRNAGIAAILGYKFNEHWEMYVYAQKSIVNARYIPLPPHYMNALGDRIGASVHYHIHPNFSIQLSVESDLIPPPDHRFHLFNHPNPLP